MTNSVRSNCYELASILLSEKEQENFVLHNNATYEYWDKFIGKRGICRMYDWAETDCLNDIVSFIVERSMAFLYDIDKKDIRKTIETLLQACTIKQKGDYLEYLLSSSGKAIEKYNLSVVSLDNGDDYYRIFIIRMSDLKRLGSIKDIKSHKW